MAASTHLGDVDFRFAGLQKAYLGGAHLQGADLDGSRLEGAYLGGAHLDGATLDGSQLEGAVADDRTVRPEWVQLACSRRGDGEVRLVGGSCFPCRAAQEVSVPDGSTPVGVVVIVV